MVRETLACTRNLGLAKIELFTNDEKSENINENTAGLVQEAAGY